MTSAPPARAGGESRDGPAVTAVAFEARGEIPDAPRATAYVPQDLIAYDENGEELEAGELTVVVAAIASEKAVAAGAIPASGVADISNPNLIENDPVLGADISDASRVIHLPLGAVNPKTLEVRRKATWYRCSVNRITVDVSPMKGFIRSPWWRCRPAHP